MKLEFLSFPKFSFTSYVRFPVWLMFVANTQKFAHRCTECEVNTFFLTYYVNKIIPFQEYSAGDSEYNMAMRKYNWDSTDDNNNKQRERAIANGE